MTIKSAAGTRAPEILRRREVIITLLVLAVLAYIFFTGGVPLLLTILLDFAIFSIVTLSLNLEVGHTGISQFGRVIAVIAGAFAVGAVPGRLLAWFMGLPHGAEYADDAVNYTVVPKLTELLASSVVLSVAFLLFSLILAAVCGALVGWLTSRPAIRLKEAYLGISLLAFGDLMMWVGHNWEPLVGGTTAVFIPDPFRVVWAYRFPAAVGTALVLVFLTYVLVRRLTKSPFGRALNMIRDSDVAAAVCGKDMVKLRTYSLMIGSALAAVGGAFYVIYAGTCTAVGFTRLTWTFWPWAYMMLGGIGSDVGILLGVLVLVVARTLILINRTTLFGFLMAWGIDPMWLEYALLGLVIIVVVLFMPHGLVPAKVEPVLPVERVRQVAERRPSEQPDSA
ncbi:MAG: branched-chain amino acid ABC transporter permease [Firmicutes bacterium]|nr:branched-chain amino acid ABC transporter permease [Bacillota bacterium]